MNYKVFGIYTTFDNRCCADKNGCLQIFYDEEMAEKVIEKWKEVGRNDLYIEVLELSLIRN